nr:hypothetical protein [Mesorhizobium sp.]
MGGVEVNTTAWSIKNGWPFYQIRVATDKSTLERDGKACSIMPGMVCSVEIETGRKTILSYLLKPINKAPQGAMSER